VSRYAKALVRLLSGTADQTLRFEELCSLLNRLGFVDRQRGGSHRIFSRDGVAEILNLQPRPDGTAKPYQVRQVREVILRYQLADSLVREADNA
jgi:predicted RNA binding protein YcfA (HicA-like mRNA interferase family)